MSCRSLKSWRFQRPLTGGWTPAPEAQAMSDVHVLQRQAFMTLIACCMPAGFVQHKFAPLHGPGPWPQHLV